MAEEIIWNLIAKKLAGEASETELKELEKLLRDNPDLHYPVQTIIDLWKSDARFDREEAHEAFRRHVERMGELKVDYISEQELDNSENIPKIARKIVLWPAIMVVLVIGGLFFLFRFTGSGNPVAQNISREPEKAISRIITKNGSKTNLLLPDGTKVWLNAGSSITYDSSYDKTLREVVLSGEGYFD